MALVTFDHYTCKIISPSVVLDHRLDGEDLAWVRDHLRRCEACRERIEVFRERLLREEALATGLRVVPATPRLLAAPATPRLLVSVRRRASAYRERAVDSRRYAVVALMAVLVAGFFVSSSPRFAADAGKGAPVSSTLLDTGATTPPRAPSPYATVEPSASAAASQDRTVPTVVVPSKHPTPAPTSAPAPVAAAPPSIVLRLTYNTPCCLAPLTVTANAVGASASGIASYEFDFGNGIVIRPMLGGGSASYTYCRAGRYKLTVTVTDKAGLSSSAFVYVDVTSPVNPASC